ncbi:glycine betaine ABC transporter substrate-binding protein [Staphylococcus nepalensis]|uniref:glycine betaine ABC transporter substrate-binding protein n=1 Tax=Staphylococcus nepalensis TaxID=214473 RepID=UPI0024BA037C|nr:glycine betaine ABC transporter substrate-binding protein [Staphylococcus nepalensis]
MLKKKSVKILGLVSIIVLSLLISACSNGSKASNSSKTSLGGKEVEIPYVATDNSAARSLVIAEVLKKAGYDVTATPVEASGPMYAAVSENKDAFHASGIFPSTDKSYFNKFKNNLTKYDKEHLVEDVKVGLAVPKYERNIDSITDLKDNDDFGESVDWNIQGTDARNGAMKQTKSETGEDNLERYQLKESSDQDQFSKIQEAHKKQDPIIFTAMEPSWMAEELDYKMLDDPDKIYGKNDQNIDLVFNNNFKEQHPGAYTIATRMAKDWKEDDEKDLAKNIFVDNKNPQQAAKDYVDNHDNKVDEWTKNIEKQ